jgi:hypothetical protein
VPTSARPAVSGPRIPKPDEWFTRLSDATLEKIVDGSLPIARLPSEIAAAKSVLSRRSSVQNPRSQRAGRHHPGRGGGAAPGGVREPRRPKPGEGSGVDRALSVAVTLIEKREAPAGSMNQQRRSLDRIDSRLSDGASDSCCEEGMTAWVGVVRSTRLGS